MSPVKPSPERLEEALLQSTRPREELSYDGWLVRRAHDDVKRACSVSTFGDSTLPLAEKIDHCERLFASEGLSPVFRLTDFSRPADLDQALAERGYVVFEPSLVQIASLSTAVSSALDGLRFDVLPMDQWVELAGKLRGVAITRREAEARRLAWTALPGEGGVAFIGAKLVACGLLLTYDKLAGLFDVFTAEEWRGRGCCHGAEWLFAGPGEGRWRGLWLAERPCQERSGPGGLCKDWI